VVGISGVDMVGGGEEPGGFVQMRDRTGRRKGLAMWRTEERLDRS
jgi:hypothetical protein